MKKIALIFASLFLLSISLPILAKTDTTLVKQGNKILVFQITQESKNHDSLKITTEKLLTAWPDLPVFNKLNTEDYKQLLLGKIVYIRDTSDQAIITSLLPVKEIYQIKNTEYRLQGQEIAFFYKSDYYSPEKISWWWTTIGVIIPIILILIYGFISWKKKNWEFLVAILINLLIFFFSFIVGLFSGKDQLPLLMFLSLAIVLAIYKIAQALQAKHPGIWQFWQFYQMIYLVGIFTGWFLVYVIDNPGNLQKPYILLYFMYFVGLHSFGFLIMQLVKKIRKKVIFDRI